MSEKPYSTKQFNAALERGELSGCVCTRCGRKLVPAREICPSCGQDEMQPFQFSGKGKLAAYTVICVPPTMMAEAGYSTQNPYCVGIVELEEGPRVSAQILDVDLDHPEQIGIGKSLRMAIIARGPEGKSQKYLAFR